MLLDPVADLVLVTRRVKRLHRNLIDQLQCELELLVLHFDLADVDVGGRTHLVGIMKLLHHETVVRGWSHHHDELLPARRVFADRNPAARVHRLGQQHVRLVAALVGPEVIDLVVVDGVHLGNGHEFRDLDRLARLLFELLELFGRKHDVAILREFVTLHHVVTFDDRVLLDADVLLLEARSVLLVKKVERNRSFRVRCRVELDRYRDQTKGNSCRAD